jgi:DNA modification methylase
MGLKIGDRFKGSGTFGNACADMGVEVGGG